MLKKTKGEHLLLAYSFIFPFGHIAQNIGLLFLVTYWLISFVKNGGIDKQFLLVILFTSFFLYNGLTIFYSPEKEAGLNIFLRQLLGVIPPVLLFTSIYKPSEKTKFQSVLFIASGLFVVIIINLISQAIAFNFNFKKLFSAPGKIFSTGIVNYHYLYFSYYLLSCILILFYTLVYKKNYLSKPIVRRYVIFVCFIFFAYLFLLGSRTSLFIAIIAITCFLFSSFKSKNSLLLKSMFFFAIIGFSTLSYKYNTNLLEKLKELVNYNNSYSQLKENWGGRFMRQEIWRCSMALIQEKPIFGYGLGTEQRVMNVCLATTTKNPSLYTGRYKFNAHNQFLQFWLSSGLIGLTLFLFFLIKTLKIAFKKSNYLYILFIIISMLCFTTESMLQRNHGIIFFSFLSVLFFSSKKLTSEPSI